MTTNQSPTIAELEASVGRLVEALKELTDQCEAEFTLDGAWVNNGQLVTQAAYRRARQAIADQQGHGQ